MAKRTKRSDPFGEVRRLLFVGAHPDDLETVVCGTIHTLIGRGVEVCQVLCTDGNIGSRDPRHTRASLARTRRRETRAAAKFLGINDLVFLGHSDGELEPSLRLRAQLAREYRRFQPDTLMAFDPYVQGHPDHRAAGRAALDALIPASMPLYHPERLEGTRKPSNVQRTFLFGSRRSAKDDILVDVTPLWGLRLEAMRLHTSQFGSPGSDFSWLETWLRAQGKAIGVKYAEKYKTGF